MCGIVGYTGNRPAGPILLDGLKKLEYRGYDSAGIAVRNGDAPADVVKTTGRLINLANATDEGRAFTGTCGIGHTRWATHGEPSRANAHPHVSGNAAHSASGPVESAVVGVHNGIIENFEELRQKLINNGYRFYSGTDTEVVIKLVDYYYKKYKIGPIDAINRMMVRVRGSYALALMFSDYPGEIYAARRDSPLIIGVGEGETFLASDVPAILKYTRSVCYIDNLQSARLLPGEAHFFDLNGDEIEIPTTEITWNAEAAEKGGYEHFMIKEIHEQPRAVRDTLHSLIKNDRIDLSATGLCADDLRRIRSVRIAACGSAWHVGMSAQYIIEDLCRIPVRVELASEFRYRTLLADPDDLMIVISQSGETADSLAALRTAKAHGIPTLAIVNVVGSTIAREADHVLYTLAGPEIAVATTKAYSAQLAAVYALAVETAFVRGMIDKAAYARLLSGMLALPEQMEQVLRDKERIQWFASRHANAHDIFYIGRGLDYTVGLEGGLKMKEICYIHSEAYAAGELKHGTISLVEDGTLIVGILTQKQLLEKTLSNMEECRARGGFLIGLCTGSADIKTSALDFTIRIPDADPHLVGSLAIIPLQLLAYYTSVQKGLDVDKPRNLAKSVTVE